MFFKIKPYLHLNCVLMLNWIIELFFDIKTVFTLNWIDAAPKFKVDIYLFVQLNKSDVFNTSSPKNGKRETLGLEFYPVLYLNLYLKYKLCILLHRTLQKFCFFLKTY